MADTFLALKVPYQPQLLEFATYADFKKWFEEWRVSFQWLTQGSRTTWSSAARTTSQAIGQIDQTRSSYNLEANLQNTGQVANFIRQVKPQLEKWNSQPAPFLCPSDPQSRFILEMRDKHGEDAATLALTALLHGSITLSGMGALPVSTLEGFFESYLLRAGYKDPAPYRNQTLIDFLQAEERKFDESRSRFGEVHDNALKQNEENKAELESFRTTSGELQTVAKNRLNSLAGELESSRKELADLKKTMLEGLALRAPVEYWRSNSSVHETLSKKYGRWVALGSIFIFAYILLIIPFVLYTSSGGKPELWELGVFAATTGLLLYLLRIVVRIQLSHLHLSTDAAQRAVMVQTYLSLEHDKEVMTKEDRHLILEAIFRPVGAGLVKDDQAPLSILEFLLKK